jgi:hypothetical protein
VTHTDIGTQGAALSKMFHRIAGDLSMLSGSDIEVSGITVELRSDRPAAASGVYVSFRFGVDTQAGVVHGSFMLPLNEAISLGGNLMMAGTRQIDELKAKGEVEGPLREAILEVGSFVTGALQSVVERPGNREVRVDFEGCQGVPASVRPRLEYEEGAPLVVGRAAFRLGADAAVEALLILPPPALSAA